MDFKVYLEKIGAKVGDKLEFVDYPEKSHTHWDFHNPETCSYKDFYVGKDGYMHSTYKGEDYTHTFNWGFTFKVIDTEENFVKGSVYIRNIHAYCIRNGFKAGDKLEFVKYVGIGHEHWGFHTGKRYKDLRVEEREGYLGIYMNFIHSGEENSLWENYGFIFKLKEGAEEVPRPIWCGKLYGKMTEDEKGAFLLDVLAGKKAYYGDCGNYVNGPQERGFEAIKEYVQRFNTARGLNYHYYSSEALLKSEKGVRVLEEEIADLKRRRESQEENIKGLKQKQEEKEEELAKLLS